MRTSPSIAPHHEADQDTYLVLDDFGFIGRSWRETETFGRTKGNYTGCCAGICHAFEYTGGKEVRHGALLVEAGPIRTRFASP
jgi:hypothetical protein